MVLVDGAVTIDHALCSTCTQCIAICPRQALSWDGAAPVPFDRSRLPSPEQLDELFRQRRTIRLFTDERIDRALLDQIVATGTYAPTNNYGLRAIVVDDQEMMVALEQIILRFISRIYRLFMKPRLVFAIIRRITPVMDPKDKVKIEEAMARGTSLRSDPAAFVFIVGDRRVALSEASAQYALYNMMLTAQARGLGTCLRGTGQIMLDRLKPARQLLGLEKHEHILGELLLGYPAIKFRNKVAGKRIPIQFLDRRETDGSPVSG
jgi:nitroreductase